MAVEASDSTGYSAMFREYVLRATQFALKAVQSTEGGLPVDRRDLALLNLGYALDLAEAWPLARDVLVTLAPKLEQAGYWTDWIPYLERGMERSRLAGDVAAEAEIEFQLGLLYTALGRWDQARQQFAGSAAHFLLAGDDQRQARALNRQAYVNRLQWRADEARRLVNAAMALVSPADSEYAYCHLVLGSLAYDAHDWPAAEAHYRQALAGWERLGDEVMRARGLTNLGAALRGAGKHDEAADCYLRAIEAMGKLGDHQNEAATRMNLGNVYWATGQGQQALEQYVAAERFFRQSHDLPRLALVAANMGLAYQQLQEWDKAEWTLRASMELCEQLGDRMGRVNAMDILGVTLSLQGRTEEAIAVLQAARVELAPMQGQPGYEQMLAEIEGDLARALNHEQTPAA